MSDIKPSKNYVGIADVTPKPESQLKPAQEWDPKYWQQPLGETPKVKPVKRSAKLFKFTLLALTLLLMTEAGLTLWQSWQQSPYLFALYGTVFAGSLLLLTRWLWREWRRLRQLKQAEQTRRWGQRMADSEQQGEFDALIKKLKKSRVGKETDWEKLNQQIQTHHSDAERLRLLETTVLAEQDRQAQDCIYRYSAQASLLLAASPMATLDMALMLWRNQAMLDEVARIYGLQPGYWGRIALIRQILVNLLYAGGSELAVDLGTQMLSAELTGKLSSRLAQGLGAGLLTARLGYSAMAQCRPLAFRARVRPSLFHVQGRLLTELTQVSADAISRVRAKKPESTHNE